LSPHSQFKSKVNYKCVIAKKNKMWLRPWGIQNEREESNLRPPHSHLLSLYFYHLFTAWLEVNWPLTSLLFDNSDRCDYNAQVSLLAGDTLALLLTHNSNSEKGLMTY
jgi:hypothetical protein